MNWLSVWRCLPGFSFDSINLHVCSYANPHCLDYCNLEVSFEIRKCEFPNFSYSKPPWISKWALGSVCPAPRRSQLRFHWEMGCICGWMWECFHHISVTLSNPWTYSVFLFIWNFHSLNSLIILWMKTCVSFIKWVPEYIFKIFIACMSVTNVCVCLPECVCGVQRSNLQSQFFFLSLCRLLGLNSDHMVSVTSTFILSIILPTLNFWESYFDTNVNRTVYTVLCPVFS